MTMVKLIHLNSIKTLNTADIQTKYPCQSTVFMKDISSRQPFYHILTALYAVQ